MLKERKSIPEDERRKVINGRSQEKNIVAPTCVANNELTS